MLNSLRHRLLLFVTSIPLICGCRQNADSRLSRIHARQSAIDNRIVADEKRAADLRAEVKQLEDVLQMQRTCIERQACWAQVARVNAAIASELAECNRKSANWFACEAERTRNKADGTGLGCLLGWGFAVATGGAVAPSIAIGCGLGAEHGASHTRAECSNRSKHIAVWTDSDPPDAARAFVRRFVRNAHLRTNASRMRIIHIVLALNLGAFGCSPVSERVVNVEHAAVRSEQRVERVKESYDLSEQNIARIRLSVFDLVEQGRFVSQQLEMAARDFQMAAVYNHLAGNDYIRAADSYQRAATTYRRIASLMILLASSERLLDVLCKQPTNVDRYRRMLAAFGVKLDGNEIAEMMPRLLAKQNVELAEPGKAPLELPLPVMNVLVKRAARMLLCE